MSSFAAMNSNRPAWISARISSAIFLASTATPRKCFANARSKSSRQRTFTVYCSGAARGMRGQTLVVDGGVTHARS